MQSPRAWFITGASSGLGRSMAERVLSKGDIAVATLRKPEALDDLASQYPKDKLLILKLDVTNQTDIDSAFAKTKEAFGRIDVVFNNAGFGVAGEIEGTPVDAARGMFDVNFWGASNVSRAAVNFFRQVNGPGVGGTILQISSVSGFAAPPCFGYYSASKHAIEGFTEGLAKELSPAWNIKICIIEPGAFRTNVLNAAPVFPVHPAYADEPSSQAYMMRQAISTLDFEGDAGKFARTVYEIANGNNIPARLPMGLDAVGTLRAKGEGLIRTADETQSWSADLKRESGGATILVAV
ncbi:NAD(P)-binding protein [Leucogyrophana mollusca]|uniref:NAD(P)-binding protein n=1 Tax=Leucogyrophana mollusca TaxID=85980 RepID=A0ACB8B5Q8_9AGAM|nr:NAD(P)-binding protein [Leucogyrophana mollusca]